MAPRATFRPAPRGSEIAKGISPSLAKRTVAMALDGKLADLADPIEHDAKIEFIDPRRSARAGTDPSRCRACARRGGAVAVSRHAGHHRPGDRERLLLRFLPQRSRSRRRIFAAIEKKMARDHRARQTLHQGNLVARSGQGRGSRSTARPSRSNWSTPFRRIRI